MTSSNSASELQTGGFPDRPTLGRPANAAALSLNSIAFLDLMRAFAANIVLLGHADLIFNLRLGLNLGMTGVSIFFLLSGFLIMQSSMERIRQNGPYFGPYLTDRFARIFTAYIPALALVAILNVVLPLAHNGHRGTSTGLMAFVGNLLLLQDYPFFQAAYRLLGFGFYISPYNTAEPFWTIPIEFWIYVIFGLGFFVLVARERLRRLPCIGLAAIALPVVVWNAAAGGGNGLSLVWLVGAAGAYLWVRSWHASRHQLQIGVIVLVTAAATMLGRGLKTNWDFQDIGLAIVEASMILAILSIAEAVPVFPTLARRACTFFASYSYSLYLIHNTVLVIVRQEYPHTIPWTLLLFSIFVCHAIAFLMYVLFERHYRHVSTWLKYRFGFQQRMAN